MTTLLNYLHRKGLWNLLCWISTIAYFLKGYGFVKAVYHKGFRAYEYKVQGVTYLSLGPGWAYNFEFLKNSQQASFCHQYMPQSGDCVVDIGAGLGEETVVYALLVGAKGKVHALEANPVTFAGLEYLCYQNAFTWVVPHHLAIYKTDGEVTIEDDPENYLTNTIQATGNTRAGVLVKAKKLDTLVRENNITRIDFLKSNIEGAEQFLIEGMTQSVGLIRHICISCHDFRHNHHQHGEFYVTKQKVKSFLEEQGFEVTLRHTGDAVVDDYVYGRNKRLT